uniref:Uncharacterized protein n=1 Tax=Rousettus aegyptiacus TaxID=9407 RepID=A0A7J8FDB1_ROUAE|nr:hypothetical protein HJG63_000212 [Rousettus aegyptiacus]
MNHTCLLVRQICWRPPGRGHLPREGAGGQPPAAGAGGRAEGLQYLGEHPLSAGPSAVCMTIRCLQDHPLSAGPSAVCRTAASALVAWCVPEAPFLQVPVSQLVLGSTLCQQVEHRDPNSLWPWAPPPYLCTSTLSDIVGPILTMPVKCSAAVSGQWSLW